MRRSALLVGIAFVITALASAATAAAPTGSFQITITNLTTGQWLTPPAAATHSESFSLFSVGNSVTVATQEIAENGNLDAATGAFEASPFVFDWAVTPSPTGPPPIGPGSSVTFEIDAPRHALLSFASMLICTNDGFTGIDGIRLPTGNRMLTEDLAAYDAGSEINTEAWADLVPPCAMLTGFGDQGGTGLSNPALAENGVISHHPGIDGIADLVPAVHGWTEPVARIEITPVR